MHTAARPQARSIVSPEDQKVTFVELFFDLVFVFAVTQIVGLLHGHLTLVGVGQALIVFWLIWWAWTQFTWTLNPADTTHPAVELLTLGAAAITFFMAAAVPGAFGEAAPWFGIPYVMIRVIGLGLQMGVGAAAGPTQHGAARKFALFSATGLAAVLAGSFTGGEMRYWLWGFAILLDVIAAVVGGSSDSWNLRPDHFSERHGLFVIIALGESLIVAAGGVSAGDRSAALLGVGVLSVGMACAFWWSYFPNAKPLLDHALEKSQGARQADIARDAFSLLHFPLVCGIIAFALAVDEAMAHPDEPLPIEARIALALSIFLFLGSTGAALRRACGRWAVKRLTVAAVTTAAVLTIPGSPLISLGVALAGLSLAASLDADR